MKTKSNEAEKAIKSRLSDPDSYLETLAAAMSDSDKKRMAPIHVANILALTADLTLSHMDGISEAFEKNNGLEITFKAKLAREKDNLTIQFKPVNEFKDSASASVPDPDQEEMDFRDAKSAEGSDIPTHESDDVPMKAKGLPNPLKSLPSPEEDEVIDAEIVDTDNVEGGAE